MSKVRVNCDGWSVVLLQIIKRGGLHKELASALHSALETRDRRKITPEGRH
jgi:hypothetical protein